MLEIKNIYKTYKTKKGVITRALDGVSLTFPEKGMVFILGKSGSGKSTLLNICGGLDRAESGEIVIKGKSSSTFSQTDFDSYRNTCVGFVFQEYNILNEFSVEENIAIALELQNKKRDPEQVARILESVDMREFASRKPATLSGGQKQRVAIARALVKNPEIILADEPSGALDSDTGKQVFDTLKKLSADKLVIVVSHDREFAEKYADRIIELKDGRVLSDLVRAQTVNGENVTFIGTDTVCINERSELTQSDMDKIREFLSSSAGSAVITAERETVTNIKSSSPQTAGGFGDIGSQPQPRAYSAEEQKLIRSRLPIKHALRLGASGLKVKPVRLVFTVFLTTIAFIMFGLFSTMMLYNERELVIDAMKSSDAGYVQLIKNYKVTERDIHDGTELEYYNYTLLTHEEFERIKSVYPGSFAVVSENGNYFIENLYNANADYGLYGNSVDRFLLCDDGMQMLAGELPQSENEVAVTDFVFESLKAGGVIAPYAEFADAVGETLQIQGVPLKITGVFRGESVPAEYEDLKQSSANIFMSSEEYEKLNAWQQVRRAGLFAKVAVSQKFVDKYTGVIFQIKDFDGYDYFRLSADSIELRSESIGYISDFWMLSRYDGKLPLYNLGGEKIDRLGINALAFSNRDLSNMFKRAFSSHPDADEVITMCDKLNSLNIEEVLQGLAELNQFMADNGYRTPELYINGRQVELGGFFFAAGYTGSDWCCYLGDGLYSSYFIPDAYFSRAEYNTKYVYNPDANICAVLIPRENGDGFARRLVNGAYGLQADDSRGAFNAPYMGTIEMASIVVRNVRYVLLGVGLVLAAFSILLMFNFISASITAKKKEIGILRALGARTFDVFGIFFMEGLIIALTCFVISCLGTLGLCGLINGILRGELLSINLFIFGPLSVLCVLAMTIITAFVSTAIPVALYSRKPPVDSIRSL